MDAGKPTIVVDIEEGGISERIDATKYDFKRSEITDRTFRHRDEFLKAVECEFIAVSRSIIQKAKLLDRDVKKVIGMEADEWQRA